MPLPPYYKLDDMIAMIDEPNRKACRWLLADNRVLFGQAAGSSYNHQAWTGGYWDHITEAMNLWILLYKTIASTGRFRQLIPQEQFSLSDGLLVLFWHDIEKPWRFELRNGKVVVSKNGRLVTLAHLATKEDRKAFAEQKMARYGLVLSPALRNAFKYVEGIRDTDYTPFDRRMWPLAALCHVCDLLSARMFYDFPLAKGNTWGVRRIAS